MSVINHPVQTPLLTLSSLSLGSLAIPKLLQLHPAGMMDEKDGGFGRLFLVNNNSPDICSACSGPHLRLAGCASESTDQTTTVVNNYNHMGTPLPYGRNLTQVISVLLVVKSLGPLNLTVSGRERAVIGNFS